MSKTNHSQICAASVIDDTFPNVDFDAAGISWPARNFTDTVWPQVHIVERDPKKIWRLVDQIKRVGKDNEFDSVLGLSGGLDSSYMLHLAVTKFGLRPLVVHVDGGWNTQTASRNVKRLVEGLSLDLLTEVINWEKMRDFQLAWFRSGTPYLDIAQDHAFIAAIYRIAEENGVRFILNGGNFATEGIRNPLKYYYYGTDMTLIRHIEREYMESPLDGYPLSPIWRHKLYLRHAKGVRVVKPLNMLPYRKFEAETQLAASYGWEPYPQKHFESRFTRFFEGYWLPSRFDFDPRKVELSSLVLTGQMSRRDALNRLEVPPLSAQDLAREKDFLCSKLQISQRELEAFHSMPKKYYWDFPNQSLLFDVGSRISHLLRLESNPKK